MISQSRRFIHVVWILLILINHGSYIYIYIYMDAYSQFIAA